MGKEFFKKTTDLLQAKQKKKQWQKIVISLSLVVAMITSGLLIHPAITMERKAICGQEEHTHSAECYEKKLVCDKEEHTASEVEAAKANGENIEEHKHSDSCYKEELTCDKKEHKHSEDCYPKETEAKEETTKAASTEEAKATAADNTEAKTTEAPKAEESTEASNGEKKADEAKDENTEEKQEEKAEARTLTAKGDDYTVQVDCPAEAKIPENAELKVREIVKDKESDKEYEAYYKKAQEALKEKEGQETDISTIRFFDISFMVDGEEIEPAAKVEVKITYDKKVEVSDKGEVKSVHFGDEKTEILDTKTNKENGKMDEITFDATSFSVYAVVGTETLSGDVLTADGKTYTVTVTYGADAKIPEGATLKVEEVDQNSDEYINYSDQALKAITDDKDVEIASARFFDVSIIVDGKEYEPQAPVTIKITYNDPFNVEIGDEIKQVHFAENGTEVLDVDVNKDDNGQITDVIFDQGSFSVTGTVVTTGSNGWPTSTGYYALIVKANNGSASEYYAVKKDGTLREVIYDDVTKKVSFPTIANSDELLDYEWEYSISDSNKYLHNGNKYIDPRNGSGYSTSKRNLKISNGMLYATKSGTKYYLAFDSDSLKLYGKQTDYSTGSNNIATVFFANAFSADSTAGGGSSSGDSADIDLGAPATSKTLDSNGDGTYKLSLSVTGKSEAQNSKSKADVLVVFDTSGSMDSSRMSTAKTAIRELASALLANNTPDNPDTIRMSMLTFSTNVNATYEWTTEEKVFAGTKYTSNGNVNWYGGYVSKISTEGDGGTNWEEALQKANELKSSMRSEAAKYVIFVSDGNPTFHVSDERYNDKNDDYGVYGTGYEDRTSMSISGPQNVLNCYNAAKDDARILVKNGMNFYTVGVFGNPDRMSNLTAFAYSGNDIGTYPEGHYQTASNTTSLKAAFQSIINDIQKNFTYTDVTITDGITDLTSTASIVGTAGQFTYTVTNAEGNEVEVPANIQTAKYDVAQKKVIWSLGDDYKLVNGYTYKVSFTVWPTQQAYDIIAALKNGDITFGATDAIVNGQSVDWSQFVNNNDGSYSLKTNTEANVSYRQITTINGTDGTPSEPKTTTISATPSMPLANAEITIKKNWENDSESTRPSSIALKVMCDGNEYKTITLTKVNNWESKVYIAPGLKVKDQILEQGHNYTLIEDNNSSYNFSTETVHPMLVDSPATIIDGNGKDLVLEGTNIYIPSKFNVKILKTPSGSPNVGLAGAEFKLCTDEEGNNIASDANGKKVSISHEKDGIYAVGNLTEGTYYLFETKAPDGYNILTTPVIITVSHDGVTYSQEGNSNSANGGVQVSADKLTYTLNVTNTTGQALPNTGGSGTLPYTLGGLMLMSVAALMYGFIMRRRGRRLN